MKVRILGKSSGMIALWLAACAHVRIRTAILVRQTALLLAALLALPGGAHAAQCTNWDVSGDWFIKAGNETHSFHLTVNGYEITGRATYGTRPPAKVTGTFGGGSIYLFIQEKALELRGEIESDGKIHGVLHDLRNENNKLLVVSSRPMKCMDKPATSAPPPAPKPTVGVLPGTRTGQNGGGFIQMFPNTPVPSAKPSAPSASADTDDASGEEPSGKHKKKHKHRHNHVENDRDDQ